DSSIAPSRSLVFGMKWSVTHAMSQRVASRCFQRSSTPAQVWPPMLVKMPKRMCLSPPFVIPYYRDRALRREPTFGAEGTLAVIRIHTGSDGKSHCQEIVPKFDPRGDKSETAELIPGSGIVVRRFEPTRSNPWHHAPGRYAVFTLSGAVDI